MAESVDRIVTTKQETAHETAISPAGRAILLGAGLTVLWIGLGFWRPTTTYHLAPLLIGATPAAFAAGSINKRTGVLLGAVGLGLALAAFGLLASVPGLDGPTIGPFSSATQESVILSVIGAVGGGLYAAVVPRS